MSTEMFLSGLQIIKNTKTQQYLQVLGKTMRQ